MHKDIAQIIEYQNQKIADHFKNFQNKLLITVEKMRLGALHQTYIKIIDTIQNVEMDRIREQSEDDNIAFQKIFREGLTKIILTLPT